MATDSAKDRDTIAWNIFQALDLLCKNNATCSAELRSFLPKQIWNSQDRETVVNKLSKLFLNVNCVVEVGSYFRPLVLDIAARTKKLVLSEGHSNVRLQRKFAVALGLVLPLCPELERFTGEFINVFKPFSCDNESEEPKKKKSKKEKVASRDWCKALHNLATRLRDPGSKLSVKMVSDYLSDQDPTVRWHAAQTYCHLTGMTEQKRSEFLRLHFTAQEQQECMHGCYQEILQTEHLVSTALGAVTLECLESSQTHTRHQLLPSDLDSDVVSITGVLLPRLTADASTAPDIVEHQWVGVCSMRDSLRSLALAVSAGKPVLVQGPVGCGKTLLVQHLAALTGRQAAPHLIKVQLGDQTDSKALLGTYQCTEVPGQFVWRPGVLTEAVTKGHWVLLEDLDHAPMEVVSTLAPLLHTSTLSLPGHGDLIHAAPGFQLFATQRLFASGDGLHSQNRSSAVLDKLWTQVTIQPLSRTELKQVIVTRFPSLPPVVDRLLDIYFMLSAGRHHMTSDLSDMEVEEDCDDVAEENTVGKFLSLTGRLISTRDLMSWCGCVSGIFVPSSPTSAELILQAAIDCFVSCLPNPARRLALAKAIATHLSLTDTKAEYFLSRRMPHVEEEARQFTVGNIVLPCKQETVVTALRKSKATFSFTRPSVCLLEKVAACVKRNEPVLLVGETGTGKTSSVQFLAQTLGHKLHVINLNQQSDSVDLLGGFKPVDLKFLMMPLRERFERLFCKTFSRKQNVEFLHHLQNCFTQKRWHDLLALMEHSCQGATTLLAKKQCDDKENESKWRKQSKNWQKVATRIKKLKTQVKETENVLAFSFMEGTLVKALKSGDWVLLDEINLAAAETLQCLAGLLESTDGSLVLTDRGNTEPVIRHADFRLFACMNPATDVGKKDLTPGVRNRFTEFYVDELVEGEDLRMLVGDYLSSLSLTGSQLKGMVKFYTEIRQLATTHLVDGTGHKPHYSLRTLCRALRFIRSRNCGSVARSLYEGFCLSFLTQLDRSSHPVVTNLICQHVLGKTKKESILRQPLPQPSEGSFLKFCDYWISQGGLKPCTPDDYIITPSVKENLKDLARVVSAGSHPVLLQGETSVGKTSLITWLARSSGNHCLRVNNHEHTDLQEYVGCYAADETGKLVFKEGVLVEAMRKGYWIILDELNLAPTDVLEALNRLLDDNQELFIPETQEMVKAHPKFMLFATQNPPGHYGGRKMLSRAFRNRFVELHFDEIPKSELETILHRRCDIPLSYAKRLVAVMLDLQVRRHQTGLFAGKQSWMTLRDLFRWADRYKSPGAGSHDTDKSAKFYNYDQHMADHGYMLLAGRVRKVEEETVIREVIEKHFKKCKVDPDHLFTLSPLTSPTVRTLLQTVLGKTSSSSELSSSSLSSVVSGFEHVVWTHGMRRLAVLIGQAIQFGEPILLVGDTGCGKTTVCQLYAAMKDKHLHAVNCHLHTESADFLGGLRPVRSHTQEEGQSRKLFEWVDGPLVSAMKQGAMFLIDEISLADDSVLERLNSVLEPERSILLAEKGGGEGVEGEVEVVKAAEGFQVFATMNPGGDFGKKELSPALRNRFTEIWCPQSNGRDDLMSIIEHNMAPGVCLTGRQDGVSGFGAAIMDFVAWFSNNEIGKRCTISIRDILSWVRFVNTCTGDQGEGSGATRLQPAVAYMHGACLVFLDSLGSGTTSRGSDFDTEAARSTCLTFLQGQVKAVTGRDLSLEQLGLADNRRGAGREMKVELTDSTLSIFPFSLPRETGSGRGEEEKYAMQAPTTCVNAQRILRGLQLSRPLLLEGAPGVGKTSLVAAVARLAGRQLVRINLSEQTDVTDLFGADLPVEGETGGSFAWRDGPFLQALKAGHWVVFDEMNLASQSVLEGLNACLDHRGEVFVPELARTFHIQPHRTRIFACQNPLNQGGGRKGLPRSFLNRFTQVYVEPLSRGDLIFICTTMYSDLPHTLLSNMVDFNMKMHEETMVRCAWGHRGAPWEFNLRDISRWCDLLLANQATDRLEPGEYVSLVYQDRMRTSADKLKVAELYRETFGHQACLYQPSKTLRVGPCHVQAGHAFLQRHTQCVGREREEEGSTLVLHHSLAPLESLMTCVNMGWMAILVGSASSGKTSLVRLLAELSGHTLHTLPMSSAMDTTELLGGFEQADVGRHIAELTEEVVEEVRLFQQRRSVRGDKGSVGVVASLDQQLLALWTQPEEDAEEDAAREKEALLNRIQQLQKLIAKLCRLEPPTERLIQLSESLKKEQEALERSEAGCGGGGGGVFEWVNSLLVKALCAGHWLLIDNVNFCSPSVLDRLNALLEPRGVLTINERGVMTDGTVPTITPHPDFRLFLSMDPKYGEISRAMRNRGVEIYILGEGDGCPYNDHDTLSMVHQTGLHSKQACDWLMALHAELREKLAANEKPGLCELLRCAMVAKQQQEKGIGVAVALRYAAQTVYVRNMKSLMARQLVCSILSEHLDNLKERDAASLTKVTDDWTDWALVAPSVQQFQCHSGLTSAQQAARVFAVLLTKHGMERFCPSVTPCVSDSYLHSLRTAFSIFLAHQTRQDWSLACDWIKSMVAHKKTTALMDLCQTQEEKVFLEKELTQLLKTGDTFLQLLFKDDMVKDLVHGEGNLCEQDSLESSMLESTSWDHGTNMQVIRMAERRMVQAGRQDSAHVTNTVNSLLSSVYRLELLLVMKLMTDPLRETIAELENISCKAIRRKSEQGTALYHVCQLLTSVLHHLPHLISTLPDDKTHLLHQAQDRLLWLPRLFEESVRGRERGEVEEVYLSHLALHWSWCYNKLLTHLVMPNSAPAVQTAITKVNSILGDDNSAAKIFVTFWSSWGHPSAYSTETSAKLWQELCRLSGSVAVDGSMSVEVAQQRVKALRTLDGRLVCRRLAFIANKLFSGDFDVESDLNSVREQLETHKLLHSENSSHASIKPPTTQSSESKDQASTPLAVQLWPAYEYLDLLAELSLLLLSSKARSETGNRVQLADFKMACSPAALCFEVYKEQGMESEEEMRRLLHVLQRLWTSPAVNSCTRWLTWDDDSQPAQLPVQDTNGPAVLHRSAILLYASHLLSSSNHNTVVTSQYDLLPLNVTLRGINAQLSQLSDFTRYLWKHAGLLSSGLLSPGKTEEELLTQSFISLLTALTPLIDTDRQEEWSSIITTLSSKDSKQRNVLRSWQENASDINARLSQLLNFFNQHCTLITHGEHPVLGVLSHCFEALTGMLDCQGGSAGVGRAMVCVGLSLLYLLAPKGPVDPVHKATVKLEHYRQELSSVEIDIQVWEAHLKLTTGDNMADINPDILHPRLAFLLRRRADLVSAIADLEKRHAFRGDKTEYLRLSQEVETILETLASVTTVQGLVSKLHTSATCARPEFGSRMSITRAVLREEQTWQTAAGRFCKRLCAEYPYLPDLTVPVCVAVEQMRLGMRVLSQEASLRVKQCQVQYWPGSGQLDKTVSHLCSFPSLPPSLPTWLHLASSLSSPATRDTLTCLLTCDQGSPVEQSLSRLLSSSLQLVKIHAQQTGELTPDLCLTLTHVLDLFVKAWQEQEDARREKEEEEASLYHFKDKKHGDDRTEEEKDEAAFKLAFPSFRDDFADMIEATTLEEVGRKESPMEQEETAIPESITEQEMDDICTIHVNLVRQLTSAEWLSRQQSPWIASSHGWDVLKPVLLAYQVFAEIGKNSWELLSEQVDSHTLGSHLIVCGTLAHSLQTTSCDGDSSQSSALRPPSPTCYNVYVDPNVEEVMQCGPVLRHLVTRVKELLQEWPQHPILNQILQLVERIESFPVMSPVVKFLTGVELLLEKAQHWERNAASHVSLATQLSEVTALIVRWRKLELKCWSGALDIEVERCRRKASRWWFHLYTLTSTYLSNTQGDCELAKVLESLKQFVEGSSVGEFTTRLDILLAFHCHLVHTPSSTHRDQLLPVLWNLHQFYNQFRPTVETEIARFRAPIEKELKGFVKIARWSEMNYWALKESTEKTHRTVHKHARTFQTLLNQPVRPHLGEKHSDLATEKTSSSSLSYSQHIEAYHQHSLQSSRNHQQQAGSSAPGDEAVWHQSVSHLVSGCSLLPKVPSLCQRALKHWRSCLTASSLCEDIALLDDLTGELIEEASELQKLDVPQGVDREKQKTEAKHIHLRKRAALADCFKQLSSLGLSFKKGLLKEKTNYVDNALHLSPFNPAASLEKGSRLETLWAGCDMYFTRCLSRLAQFSAALYAPSKDLGMDNIQRCQGFVEHLTEEFMTQRLQLTHTFSSFTLYRKLVSAVDRLKGDVFVSPQQDTRHWLDTIKKEVTQVNQGLTQFSLLLQACPTTSTSPDSPALSPFPPSALPPMAQLKHGDELWTKCWTSVQTYLQSASSMQTSLLSLTDTMLFTSEDVNTLSKTVTQLTAIGKGVQEMVQALNSHVNNNCLTSSLTFLTSSLHKLQQNFTEWTHNLDSYQTCSSGSAIHTEDVSCFVGKVEHLVESVLLSVQKLVKCSKEEKKMVEKSSEGKEEEEDEEEEDVKECQLVSLAEQLHKHVSLLDSEKLTQSLQEVCHWLEDKTNATHTATGADHHTSEVSACVKLLSGSRPLLLVYCEVLENHVARSIALHRTLAKMLSVMLSVFTQLALKGFCLPAEYSDEAGGEGATDFKDIEGGGIGEGQGSKDVSDQIESEDQLDETKLPEEEKDKSEDQQPDIAPEDNAIEMTDDFDSKPQDMEPVEGDDNDDDNEEKEEEDAEKQMGEVDGPDSDKLDDQMWGSDEEEETEDKNEREEDGPGSGEQEKMELMAKEDLPDGADNEDKKDNKKNKDEKDEDNNDTEVPDFQDFDESEYDDHQPDNNQGQEEREEPENLDLPEDLNLDQNEQDGEENAGESPPDEGEEDGDLPEDAEEENVGEEKGEREQEEKNEESKEGEEEDGLMEENKDTNVDENQNTENESAEDEKNEEKDGEEGEKEEEKKTEEESAGQEREDEEEGVETKGFNAQEKDKEAEIETEEREDSEKGKLSHETEGGLQNEDAEDNTAGENDQDESEGQGQAASDQQEGHEGSSSSQFTEGSAPHERKQSQRRPGQSKEDRSLGSAEEKFRRLKTSEQSQQRPESDKPSSEDQEADMYEHITDETSHADAQTLDAATDTQQKQQAVVARPEDEGDDQLDDDDDDVKMMDEEEENEDRSNKMLRDGSKQQQKEKGEGGEEKEGERMEMDKIEIPGSFVETLSAERPPESTIHTHLQHLHLGATMSESDVEALRSQLESSMTTWTQADLSDHQAVAAAAEAWQKYETLTSSLSQELCEQLRLVLEPSQATKLKGDYRTGKRLNMRKVIPYIASQFRKDKIWLRRTKPSKRQYQIMIAIDDSSSMADNHSKQLAFESLALTANALTLLETGELGVCSFGKTVQLLHPFTETFSNQAGARILQQFTFEQTQTRVALMLEQVTGVMLEARSQQQGWLGRPETAQLLLIVSDGRGINAEGMSVVRQAVRKAREANIFVVFVILDDPKNKNSILDIRLTTFKDGMPVFHSYMEEFPFPFYVILRDINSLPQVLSDALRQWFELVTASAS